MPMLTDEDTRDTVRNVRLRYLPFFFGGDAGGVGVGSGSIGTQRSRTVGTDSRGSTEINLYNKRVLTS